MYYRKMMKNNYKSKKNFRAKEEAFGSITGIQDKNGKFARVGDTLRFSGKKFSYTGVLLYSRVYDCYGIFYNILSNFRDKYDADSYYSFIEIPTDNGAKMNLEIINVSL